MSLSHFIFQIFFFNDTATTEIYTLSLHDALPISATSTSQNAARSASRCPGALEFCRSEEHTSELQSPYDIVCRLLLEKKKKGIVAAIEHKKSKIKKKNETKRKYHTFLMTPAT